MGPVHPGFRASIARDAALKSVTTEPATGATIDVIVHALFVIEVKVEPTLPLMVLPGPSLVQVTVPTAGKAFVPRTVKGAAVPSGGATATCADAGEAP